MEEIYRLLKEIKFYNAELFYSVLFHDTIKGGWFPENQSLSLGRGALDYSGMYVLYRILNDTRPMSILECGMGQSTKMISYYNIFNPQSTHRVIEHDDSWIEFFTRNFSFPENTEIVKLKVVQENIEIEGIHSNTWHYVKFLEKLSDRKYDFLMIDGPYGYNNPLYSRVDLLELIPDYLEDTFAIYMHDVLRQGEQETMKLVEKTLKNHNIKYCKTVYENTEIIVSENQKFLCTL